MATNAVFIVFLCNKRFHPIRRDFGEKRIREVEDFLEWFQIGRRRERSEGETRLWEGQRRARQRLECAELAPAFGGRAVVAGDAKAPASRAQSKRFAPYYRPS